MELLAYKIIGDKQISLFKKEDTRSGITIKNHGIIIQDKNKEIPKNALCIDTNDKSTRRFCAIIKLIESGRIKLDNL